MSLLTRSVNCLRVLLAATAAILVLANPSHAATTLLGRDINGNAVAGSSASAVFLYDSTLDITWLRNANANGLMDWITANVWAINLSVGGYSGWRLPHITDTAAPGCDFSYSGGTDCGFNVETASSEMAHLWYDELGNKSFCTPGTACTGGPQAGWGLTQTNDFQNMQADFYWLAMEYSPDVRLAWYFRTSFGDQNWSGKQNEYFAMAVREGDVLAASPGDIPEPATLALMGAALAGLGLVRRRFSVK